MHAEVVHRQLDVQLQVLPLAEPRELIRLEELEERLAAQVVEDLLNVRLGREGGKREDRGSVVLLMRSIIWYLHSDERYKEVQ